MKTASTNYDSPSSKLKKVVVAGASGFVGTSVCAALSQRGPVIALSRSEQSSNSEVPQELLEWRKCDLYSLLQTESAMQGGNVGIYLVHSMLPAARMAQGSFADFDVLAADNFARAAAKEGFSYIIYVGGIISPSAFQSEHLKSRLEVEQVLARHGVPVITLRCGLVVGSGGSSTRVITSLVKKLPIMLCPSWTATKGAPIDVEDLVHAIELIYSGSTPTESRHYDLGGPEIISYQAMMQIAAEQMGVTRKMFGVPFFSPKLSRLWVSLMTGAPKSLMKPLIESLKYDMIPEASHSLPGFKAQKTFAESIRLLLNRESVTRRIPRAFDLSGEHRKSKLVQSVQRVRLARTISASEVAEEYFRWLGNWGRLALRVTNSDGRISISLKNLAAPLLLLEKSQGRSTPDRELLYIVGGLLAEPSSTARMEFREIGGQELLIALHDYKPRLPWYLYLITQAPTHLFVMRSFARHLAKLQNSQLLESCNL